MSVTHGFVRAAGGKITRFDAPGAGKGVFQGTAGASITPTGVILLDDYDSKNVFSRIPTLYQRQNHPAA